MYHVDLMLLNYFYIFYFILFYFILYKMPRGGIGTEITRRLLDAGAV